MIISTLTLGSDLKKHRESIGLSQSDLEKLSGIKSNTISRIELGKCSPGLRTLVGIINALRKYSNSPDEEAVYIAVEDTKTAEKMKIN